MLALQVTGGYDVRGELRSRPHTGRFFLVQVGRTLLGRGHIVEEGTNLLEVAPEQRAFVGSYIDVHADIPLITDIRRVPFEGRCWYRHNLADAQSTPVDIRGELHTVEETVLLELRDQALPGSLQLYNWFFMHGIVENEIWSDFVAFQMRAAKPWCTLVSHQKLKTYLDRFLSQSQADRNVFVMMRFQRTPQHEGIRRTIRQVLDNSGLVAQFADSLTLADDLWDNVSTYMLGSRFGIAVFEQIEEQSFNPNVAIEVGYMQALQRRILVLKDRRIQKLPADLCGRIYREFDSYNIEETLGREVSSWVEELKVLGELGHDLLYYK